MRLKISTLCEVNGSSTFNAEAVSLRDQDLEITFMSWLGEHGSSVIEVARALSNAAGRNRRQGAGNRIDQVVVKDFGHHVSL